MEGGRMVGNRYGRLVVVARAPNRYGNYYWLCDCDCGSSVEINGSSLRSGCSRSCGCLHRERLAARNFRHGMSDSKEYRIWHHAKRRCFDPRVKSFPNYGGRGVSMCESWRRSFETFYADMGPCPPGNSLDRIDVNGNYEPGNCRWATALEQANNARSNIPIFAKGERITLAQAARLHGIRYSTLYNRIWHGQKPEQALNSILEGRRCRAGI